MRGLSFEAAGKTYLLRFDINALCRLEDKTGKNIDAVADMLQPKDGIPRMRDLRLMFWAGLGGKMTEEKAGDILSDLGLERGSQLLGQAFEAAFPQIGDAAATGDQGAGDTGNVTGTAA